MISEDTFTRTVEDAEAFERRRAGPYCPEDYDDYDDSAPARIGPRWAYAARLRRAQRAVTQDNDHTRTSKKEDSIPCG